MKKRSVYSVPQSANLVSVTVGPGNSTGSENDEVGEVALVPAQPIFYAELHGRDQPAPLAT